MVKMACIDCGQVEFEAETLREMLTLMMPHYFDAHQDIMSGQLAESRYKNQSHHQHPGGPQLASFDAN